MCCNVHTKHTDTEYVGDELGKTWEWLRMWGRSWERHTDTEYVGKDLGKTWEWSILLQKRQVCKIDCKQNMKWADLCSTPDSSHILPTLPDLKNSGQFPPIEITQKLESSLK